MATLHHPTLPTSIDVPDSQADAWVEQGWRREDTPTTTNDIDPHAGE